jgi:hypothetical protein
MSGVYLFFPNMPRDVDRDTFNFTVMTHIQNMDHSMNIFTHSGQ